MIRHLAITAGVLVLAGCGEPNAPTRPMAERFGRPDVTVAPGGSIQAALDAAGPGAVIHIEPGIYAESLTVTKPGIRLVGLRGTDGAEVVIENPGNARNGVRVRPGAHDFALLNVTVRNFGANGVLLVGVEGFLLSRVVTENNGAYGLFPIRSSGVIERCVASGHNDTGIYVGQSVGVTVRHSAAFGNVNGFTIENSSDVKLVGNEAYDNTAGIIVTLLPGLTVKVAERLLIAGNRVHDNNRPNFADPDDIAAAVPVGSGILVVGTDRAIVEDNTVFGNDFVGIAVGSTLLLGALAGLPPEAFADIEPNPDGTRVRGNTATGNGAAPQPPVADLLPGVDLLWDGSGSDNCWAANTFGTSFPSALPACP